MAELRPVTGKTGCAGRFWPTPAMRANRGGAQDRGDHVGVAGHDGCCLTEATASGGASWRWSRAEGEMGGTTVAMRLFIAGMSSPGCDSARWRRHGDGDVPARGKAARTDRRRQAGGVKLLRWNFNLFYSFATEFI